MIKISGIDFESTVDGCGVRVVIFFSGCKHNCTGCHNPTTHDFGNGRDFTQNLQEQIIEYICDTPFISGVTLSGGDPMYSAVAIIPFVKRFRSLLPDKDIWIYSGFAFEEIVEDESMLELLSLCDILVDGRFIIGQRDISTPYIGSQNQRIIDIKQSLVSGLAILQAKGVC